MTTEEISLKHKITDKEMAGLAREQSEALQNKSVAESDLKSITTAYKAKIEEAQAKVNGLSARIQSGYEFKNVRCIIANERPEGYRLTIRLDTGHIATRRKLDQAERQIKLTEIHDPFVAVALLPVDDETWETDAYQMPVRQDEFDALRMLPDVKMQDMKPVKAVLGDGKEKGNK
jgi:hypothetical protein